MLNLNIPGVPALSSKLSGVLGAAGSISHVANVLTQLTGMAVTPVWGVFDQDGNDALNADTVAGLVYRNGSKLIDYPVEDGGFQTYNKVSNPFDVGLVAAVGGSQDKRQAFHALLEAMAASLDTYTVVTPDKTYKSVNLERFDISRRANNGAYMLIANLYFREIRITASVNGQNKAQSADAAPVNSLGQVSPNPINRALSSELSGPAQALKSVQAGISGTAAKLIGVM